MASVDAVGDPLSAATSATSLLLWTLGPAAAAAAAASPSRARGALLGGPLVRSLRELVACLRLLGWIHSEFDLTGDRGFRFFLLLPGGFQKLSASLHRITSIERTTVATNYLPFQ